MKYSFEEVLIMLQAIEDSGYCPNEWESNFLSDISEKRKDLTEKQTKVLNKIYDKSFGGGIYENRQYFGNVSYKRR